MTKYFAKLLNLQICKFSNIHLMQTVPSSVYFNTLEPMKTPVPKMFGPH